MESLAHIPVMSAEFVDALCIRADGRYVDATFGRGGHARAILSRLSGDGRLLGLDRDPEAVAAGRALADRDSRFQIVHLPFSQLQDALDGAGWTETDGIGFDLGISSPQLADASRGFSFQPGPLDMRMDPQQGRPLSELLRRVSERSLAEILREYGDERYSARIARAILRAYREGDLMGTAELENICFHAVPPAARHGKIHPATRTFQALRIWVNDEMGQLETGIRHAVRLLASGGRLAVISFHSGEDRRVRDLISRMVNPCICPPDFPVCTCGHKPSMRWVRKKPLRPSDREVAENPRSRSARLRIAEKLT